jgi:hypothetical protein
MTTRPKIIKHSSNLTVKVKVKFTLEQATKAQRGEYRYSSTLSLTSKLDGVGGQSQAPSTLPPRKRPGIHCIGGWVGPRADLDGYGKSRPTKGFDPRTVQPVVNGYTD